MKTLRNLPGVAAIEQTLSGRGLSPELEYEFKCAVDRVSIGLFSIGIPETRWSRYEDDEPGEEEEYERQYRNVMRPYAEVGAFWLALEWDITDGDGRELECAHWFARQILAVEGELVEGAKFTPDGSGRLAEDDDNEAERWGAAIEEMAEQFMKGRPG